MAVPVSRSPLRFLIVDDHPITRAGLVSLFRESWPEATCTECSSLAEASALLVDPTWDLVLLDNKLPDGTGIDYLAGLARERPPILLFTMHEDPELFQLARLRGAKGFATKGMDPNRLLESIRQLLAGGTSFPEIHTHQGATALSKRERQVLQGILQGLSATEIAKVLGVSPQAVQSYKNRLLKKHGLDNLMELARSASERGVPLEGLVVSRKS